MEINPALQGVWLFWSFVFGAALCVLQIFFASLGSFLKRRVPTFSFRFFCDFLLLVLAAVGYVLLGYYFNKGDLRFFSLLGLCVGFFTLRAIFGKLLYKLLRLILRSIFRVFGIILSPLANLLRKTAKCLQNLAYNLSKVLAKIPLLVYNVYVKIDIVKRSNGGFLE